MDIQNLRLHSYMLRLCYTNRAVHHSSASSIGTRRVDEPFLIGTRTIDLLRGVPVLFSGLLVALSAFDFGEDLDGEVCLDEGTVVTEIAFSLSLRARARLSFVEANCDCRRLFSASFADAASTAFLSSASFSAFCCAASANLASNVMRTSWSSVFFSAMISPICCCKSAISCRRLASESWSCAFALSRAASMIGMSARAFERIMHQTPSMLHGVSVLTASTEERHAGRVVPGAPDQRGTTADTRQTFSSTLSQQEGGKVVQGDVSLQKCGSASRY